MTDDLLTDLGLSIFLLMTKLILIPNILESGNRTCSNYVHIHKMLM